MTDSDSSTKWYRQFWPWFVIALPATAVIAGLVTVYIAFSKADTLVDDNYYKDGLAINKVLEKDRVADELDLKAAAVFDDVSGEVLVKLENGNGTDNSLQLLLIHPVDKTRDEALELIPLGGGRYRADLQTMPRGRYYVRLQPGEKGLWRLNGEADFDRNRKVLLTPDV